MGQQKQLSLPVHLCHSLVTWQLKCHYNLSGSPGFESAFTVQTLCLILLCSSFWCSEGQGKQNCQDSPSVPACQVSALRKHASHHKTDYSAVIMCGTPLTFKTQVEHVLNQLQNPPFCHLHGQPEFWRK